MRYGIFVSHLMPRIYKGIIVSSLLKRMPLDVCSQSSRSSSVAFCKLGYHSSGKACCFPFSFSTKSSPFENVTLTFFSCLRDVNNAIIFFFVIARRYDEATSSRSIYKRRDCFATLAMTITFTPPYYDKPPARHHPLPTGLSVS